MHAKFKDCIEGLDVRLQELMQMPPVTMEKPLRDSPVGGIYLFSENDKHLYVGRTKRRVSQRLRQHVSKADDCPLAFRLARKTTQKEEASYSSKGGRKELLQDPDFKKAYEDAKNRIRKLDVRWVAEPDPVRQALLEIYVSVALEAEYNDFDTH